MDWPSKYGVEQPFLFNLLKHHKSAIVEFMAYAERENMTMQELRHELLSMGTSQMDVYEGVLFPSEICLEIQKKLREMIISEKEYRNWLFQGNEVFRQIILSDGSSWTLLPGHEPGRFVHIHPSRYSEHSFRTKAHTLRSAVAVIIRCKVKGVENITLEAINQVRKQFLHLSPVKSMNSIQAILAMIESFGIGPDILTTRENKRAGISCKTAI
ncbi:MAG: hypothetical protein K9H64_23540 [Bacteroidales bacterium]|nr:hypothetical protein [Bacteroidales bacterium]